MWWDKTSDPMIRFWDTCPHIIRTIPGLIYNGNGTEDIDSDGEDHAYDDSRYGLMSYTQLPTRMGASKRIKPKVQKLMYRIPNPLA
jgi:hypothetical protein